ncbi:hypothetical protein HMPREF9065_01278 [Aggregatibacter sp. oral taxon 458 str. W10330]|nr:hypothetical protein HMPREF9065_01278 [Aggregatibacter sp. oral taxon 458 str. W10330]
MLKVRSFFYVFFAKPNTREKTTPTLNEPSSLSVVATMNLRI